MRILALISLSLLFILGALAVSPAPSSGQGGLRGSGGLEGGVSSLISEAVFEQMLKHRNDEACEGKGFYTYEAFIAAADAFDGFGTTGSDATKKREIAAFLAQTSHETTGGWATAPDGPYAWGYCFVTEQGNPGDYCGASQQYPCAAGKKYYGRGPIQISYWKSHRKQSTSQPRLGCYRPHHFFQNSSLVLDDPTIPDTGVLDNLTIPDTLQPRCHHRPMDPVGCRFGSRSEPGVRCHHQHNQRWDRVWKRIYSIAGGSDRVL